MPWDRLDPGQSASKLPFAAPMRQLALVSAGRQRSEPVGIRSLLTAASGDGISQTRSLVPTREPKSTAARFAAVKIGPRRHQKAAADLYVCRSMHPAQVIGPFENWIDIACKGGCSRCVESSIRAGSRHVDRLVIPSDNAVYPGSIAGYRDDYPSRDDRLSLAAYVEGGGNGSIRNAVVPPVIVRERIYWCVARGPGLAGAPTTSSRPASSVWSVAKHNILTIFPSFGLRKLDGARKLQAVRPGT
jgi:hypothetical protein